MATCNHVHLLVDDREGGEVIPASMQLRGDNFKIEKSRLSLENTRFWQFSSYPKTT
jgi:hypothetical protein